MIPYIPDAKLTTLALSQPTVTNTELTLNPNSGRWTVTYEGHEIGQVWLDEDRVWTGQLGFWFLADHGTVGRFPGRALARNAVVDAHVAMNR